MRQLFLKYLNAFRGHWLSLMSGSASVPFAVASAFFNDWQRVLCIVAAVAFFVVANFLVWMAERKKVESLEARLVPQIEAGSPRIWVGLESTQSGQPQRRHYVQVQVACKTNATVFDCKAHLTGISRKQTDGTWTEIFSDNLLCNWSMHNTGAIDLSPGVAQFLNIASAREGLHIISLRPELQAVPNALLNLMQERAVYRFHLSITGKDVPMPCRIAINVDGSGNSPGSMKVG